MVWFIMLIHPFWFGSRAFNESQQQFCSTREVSVVLDGKPLLSQAAATMGEPISDLFLSSMDLQSVAPSSRQGRRHIPVPHFVCQSRDGEITRCSNTCIEYSLKPFRLPLRHTAGRLVRRLPDAFVTRRRASSTSVVRLWRSGTDARAETVCARGFYSFLAAFGTRGI